MQYAHTRACGDGTPGTIFGVYLAEPSKTARENALQPGNKLVAGGYCLYSSSTVRRESVAIPPPVELCKSSLLLMPPSSSKQCCRCSASHVCFLANARTRAADVLRESLLTAFTRVASASLWVWHLRAGDGDQPRGGDTRVPARQGSGGIRAHEAQYKDARQRWV